MTTQQTPTTYADALALGYTPTDQTLQGGYVSRKQDPMTAAVHVAKGHRAGQMYVLRAHPRSTRYCIRQYLRSPM